MPAGANVDAQCDSGLTALHVTCRGQAVLVATLLLATNFNGGGLQDCRGCTVLRAMQLQMHLCANHAVTPG